MEGSIGGHELHPVRMSKYAKWFWQWPADFLDRYAKAGDQHVGRTVCGLPTDKIEFAILPPYFVRSNERVSALVDKAIRLCFGSFPDNLSRVAEFCLASVVYHQGFLRETLPAQHPLFFSSLFLVENLLEELQPHVICKIGDSPNDPIRSTGITNHTENVIRLE